ncbi:MAG: hypothetical protein IPJ39_21800 [Saprospiraceae bacterium]|nr:hypothetical protein [Saprospiraceae bacterium]
MEVTKHLLSMLTDSYQTIASPSEGEYKEKAVNSWLTPTYGCGKRA